MIFSLSRGTLHARLCSTFKPYSNVRDYLKRKRLNQLPKFRKFVFCNTNSRVYCIDVLRIENGIVTKVAETLVHWVSQKRRDHGVAVELLEVVNV